MKMNPSGTGAPTTSIILKLDHPKASILQPTAFVHTPRGQRFLLSRQAKVATRDPMLSPDLQPKSAFKLTWTAQPPCLSVTPSQGQTFHPNSPEGEVPPNLTETLALLKPNELGLQHLSTTNDYDDTAKKKIPMKSLEIFTLKITGKRIHTTTWKLTGDGESVFSKKRGCPNGRSYARSWRGRRPRLSLFFRLGRKPLPSPDAPRETASHLAINTHHCCRVGHTRPGPEGAPRRSSLPRTRRTLSEPRRKWRPLAPPGRTNGRTVCLPMRSPGVTHRPGAAASLAHAPCRYLASLVRKGGGAPRLVSSRACAAPNRRGNLALEKAKSGGKARAQPVVVTRIFTRHLPKYTGKRSRFPGVKETDADVEKSWRFVLSVSVSVRRKASSERLL
ncbi:PREDICTED: uncharacterized protein LOC105809696 [Propithecus coquereli]|uniref:uncharacterized protein LOC105809696 n=1 Tax=Propithecus coquereli TaxID=379532 RepID=UPI00063F8235|nr:PREDICTED: uncharacterized protein LOC105809696 [Propithecus coquereli]